MPKWKFLQLIQNANSQSIIIICPDEWPVTWIERKSRATLGNCVTVGSYYFSPFNFLSICISTLRLIDVRSFDIWMPYWSARCSVECCGVPSRTQQYNNQPTSSEQLKQLVWNKAGEELINARECIESWMYFWIEPSTAIRFAFDSNIEASQIPKRYGTQQ